MSRPGDPSPGDPRPGRAAASRITPQDLPGWLRGPVEWVLARWVGRIVLRTVAGCVRVEVFDRAMTVAAQFFTSMLPLLIVTATVVERDDDGTVSDLVGATGPASDLIDQAVHPSNEAAFSVVGVLLVLVSATSLSRALTRGFAVVWEVSRPQVGLRSAWRWLAVVVAFALAVVVVQNLSQHARVLPPANVWPAALSFGTDLVVATFVPWILLLDRVAVRLLLPGATVFALVMAVLRPAADVWLPMALELSSDRYGPIGVAFTYLAWLYVVAFAFIAASVLGQVVATDEGRVGTWVRGTASMPG